MKIIFIVPYPTEGASNRFRVEQYLPVLKANGISCKVRSFMTRKFYKIIYRRGFYFLKTVYFLACAFNRILDIVRALKYDVVFIHREAFPLGSPVFESILARLGKPIIYDFDDAIFLPNASPSNNFVERLKCPEKVAGIFKMSRFIIAGNSYLADFAARHNKNVITIPTPIDTDRYIAFRREAANRKKLVIGWIGSVTTAEFLNVLRGVFKMLCEKYPYVEFQIIGGKFHIDGLPNIINKEWALDKELEYLQGFDIGIMPIPDNDWARGKCGFKAILYMSMGIPCVCSPVGINKEIIRDNFNGFLAGSDTEWLEKLSSLIEDESLRARIGKAGRTVAEEKYSVKVNAAKFLSVIEKAYNS